MYCKSETSTEADLELTKRLLSSCAQCVLLPERLIDAGQAISGCGTAYVSLTCLHHLSKVFYDAIRCSSVKKKSAKSVLSQKTLDVIFSYVCQDMAIVF